ncbi:uncharacterized protein LOC143256947 [Tachypleus tridentatus]|uniref:uncharacterized protein LOC143256947 n=1 Tax=Tachypleus tridentatus TaxID=6853 RepID=UPI003FD5E53E
MIFGTIVVIPLLFALTTGGVPKNEEQCLRKGGMCIFKNYCSVESRDSDFGLCSTREKSNVVCCHTVSVVDQCRNVGGECMTKAACHRAPRQTNIDCGEDSVCCILLF